MAFEENVKKEACFFEMKCYTLSRGEAVTLIAELAKMLVHPERNCASLTLFAADKDNRAVYKPCQGGTMIGRVVFSLMQEVSG